MTDFNTMSASGLFYAKRLGNHIHCTCIFTFFVRYASYFLVVDKRLTYSLIEYK